MRAFFLLFSLGLLVILTGLGLFGAFGRFSYVWVPERADLLNPELLPFDSAWDLWGEGLTDEQATALPPGQRGGLVRLDDALLDRGREVFWGETFGNERYLSDVVGLLDGPVVTPLALLRALASLRGGHTTDLQVHVSEGVRVGGLTLPPGSLVSTGLDVPRGAFLPLGIKLFWDRGHLRVGTTCALCHASVDGVTGQVVQGAPNSDLNLGLLLALAPNSAAFFPHAMLPQVALPTSPLSIPDPRLVEAAVDRVLMRWPPGSFDSTPDLHPNPTRIPSLFLRGGHPYGWSGSAAAGPFRGVSAMINFRHGLDAEPATLTSQSEELFGIPPHGYLAMLLNGAVNVDATPPDTTFPAPTHPAPSPVAPNGLLLGLPGEKTWQSVNALAAFVHSLQPPRIELADAEAVARGRSAFERHGCSECHQGVTLAGNRVIPAETVGTSPSRAAALAGFGEHLAAPQLPSFDTAPPLLPGADIQLLPMPEEAQTDLAWARDGKGGYKIPALTGLAWSAPYLHDGGVAVGSDTDFSYGLPETLLRGEPADAANSLRALIDPLLRRRVIATNQRARLDEIGITGEGHSYWVPYEDQQDLIAYLLSR
ncbi:hypothetical protein [Telmatospirillum sp. J64-1]|uniref:hypothetical protein n=1 Tax=Telmatospirillum sp. J64-1 TaxID=2502183 RepID=UPI001C8F55A8|nr:hypothetical protein [Telmatospirillum sp. J64-1]